MKNRSSLPARQSIRVRLMALLLGLTTVSVIIIAYLGVDAILRIGQSAQQASSATLRAQVEEYLVRLTVGAAERNDLILERVRRDAKNVAQYAAGIFEKSDIFAGGAYWRAEERMFTGPDGQYMNDETDVSDAFVPNLVDVDGEVRTVLELGAYLDFILVPTYESDPNTVAIYLGTEQDVLRYYPNINIGTIVPPDFQVTQRPWYLNAAPENNPERTVVWSPVYTDATGKGLMVTAAAPVYAGQDELIGVIGIDVTLEDIGASVEAADPVVGGYSFLVDDTGHAIALPEQGYQDILGRPAEPDEFGADLSEATTEFAPVLAEMMAGSTGFQSVEAGGRELFVAYVPLTGTGWSLASVVEAEKTLQAVATLQKELEASTQSLVLTRILPIGGMILAVAVGVGLLLTNRLVDPIQKLAAAAQQIGAGEWDTPLPQAGDDEIGVLSRAFGTMTAQIRDLVAGLEQRVAGRTRDLERRAVQLQAAAEVARDATAARELDGLLNRAVNLVRDRFGFYHAGIFLVDEQREYAVLRAATGEAGRQMLEQGHRLEVGEVGIVGYVTGSGQPRITPDVGADAVHFKNPLLPETRSEMALPLRVGERVIGALDVQSQETAAFDEDDVAVLQTMADQLAVAIENARLLNEMQQTVRELEVASGRYTQESWRAIARSPAQPWGYRYRRLGIEPVSGQPPEAREALQQGRSILTTSGLAVPIQLRDQVVGVLNLRFEGEPVSPETVSLVEEVAGRLALAMENARLLEETQRRATREHLTREITDRMRRATSVEGIVQTAVDELYRALGTSRTFVRLGGAPSPQKGAEEQGSRGGGIDE